MRYLFFLFLFITSSLFGQNLDIQINENLDIIENLIKEDKKTAAKSKLKELQKSKLNSYQQYRLQKALKRINVQQIGVSYEVINFSNTYNSNTWSNIALTYQRNINASAIIARVTNSNRTFGNGYLYELESYPVFSKKFYSYINTSFSTSDIFQNFGFTSTLYYAFGKGYEIEGGIRYIDFDIDNFISYSLGATKYIGVFYLNLKVNLGPEIRGEYIQNYKLTTRYYLPNYTDFISIVIGKGISPNDNFRFGQLINNPSLEAYYISLGISKWVNDFSFGAGVNYLSEDISSTKTGHQISFNLQLKKRF